MPLSGATANGAIPPWEPDELGAARSSAASVILVGLIAGGLLFLGTHLPKPPKEIIPVTTVHMVQLPKPPPPKPLPKPPPPPPPPPPVPIPKPVPLPIIQHPIPVPTKIPLPPKHVVIHHKPPPPKHVVIHHPPPPRVKPQPQPPPRPQPPPAPSFNFQSYAAGLRGPIQRLVHVSRAMQMLNLQGTVYIEFELTPQGRLVFAKIYRSSGNPLIDKSGLNAVESMDFARYRFPGTAPKVFALPIEILPEGSD